MAVITCTHCGASGNAPDHILGQTVRCSKCKQSFTAGGNAAAAPSPIAAEEPDDGGFPTGDDIDRPARRSSRRDDEDDDDVDDSPRRRIRKPEGAGSAGDYLMFRRFIAPTVIIVLFWIGVAFSMLGGIGFMVLGVSAGRGGPGVVFGLFAGLLYLILGPFIVRLYCEFMMVVFRVHDTLVDIREELRKRR